MHVVAASFVGSPVFGAADLFGSAAMTTGPRTRADKANADNSEKVVVFIEILLLCAIPLSSDQTSGVLALPASIFPGTSTRGVDPKTYAVEATSDLR